MEYLQVSILVDYNNIETISTILDFNFNINSLQIESPENKNDFVKHDDSVMVDWNKKGVLPNKTSLIFYLQRNQLDVLEKLKIELIKSEINFELEIKQITDINWGENWKPFFHTLELSKDIVIVPTWEQDSANQSVLNHENIIKMDPGMSFGSGTHQSTRLSATALNDQNVKNKKVLDIGTGSGVLAISASLLGAQNVIATDIDENSIKIAKSNAKENNIQNIDFIISDLLSNVKNKIFDIILGNLLLPIHRLLLPKISALMDEHSILIISGILNGQLEEIQNLINDNNLSILKIYNEDEWVAVSIRKK
ncbi:MAG: 50S ribosomal protein L11 methyltransferase [Lactobacillaceae bacterium]|jgi:ribosomal protein L11 methyltransferase|nr:50S ribosomal protein L11 methyltransferase [Lactobacillaceae bacterium]